MDALHARGSEALHYGESKGVTGGEILSVLVDYISMTALAVMFSRRVMRIQQWKTLPVGRWLILSVYLTAFIFIFSSSFVKTALGLDHNPAACTAASLLCVLAYCANRICVYFFLVEKAYLVCASGKPRLKDPLWLFNTVGMLIPYTTILVLALIFHAGELRHGICYLWLKEVADIAVIVLDLSVTVYLTAFFIIPLVRTYSFRQQQSKGLQKVAKRTLIGCIGTLLPTIGNMALMLSLKGELGWLCLLTCNIDVLMSALVLHWVTSADDSPNNSTAASADREGSSARRTGMTTQGSHPGLSTKLGTRSMMGELAPRNRVDTTITASDNQEYEEYPMGKIAVTVEHSQEVESLGRPDTGESHFTSLGQMPSSPV